MTNLIRSYNLFFSIYVVLYLNKADNDQFQTIMLPIISNLCILYVITSRETWLCPVGSVFLEWVLESRGLSEWSRSHMLLSLVFLISLSFFQKPWVFLKIFEFFLKILNISLKICEFSAKFIKKLWKFHFFIIRQVRIGFKWSTFF